MGGFSFFAKSGTRKNFRGGTSPREVEVFLRTLPINMSIYEVKKFIYKLTQMNVPYRVSGHGEVGFRSILMPESYSPIARAGEEDFR